MATLLSDVINLFINSVIALGVSLSAMVIAHESHNHDSNDAAMMALSHGVEASQELDQPVVAWESIHGHSHDSFSHDHVVEVLSESNVEFAGVSITIAPVEPIYSVYAPPVFEIDIPPRG